VIRGGVNSGQRRIAELEGLVVTATRGATVTDADGRTYTGYRAASALLFLGRNDPDADSAVAETMTSRMRSRIVLGQRRGP
jgi:glutamate-1-semialdehyde 2,1-aminomutase